MRYFNTRSVSYNINILPNILQFFERTFKICFNIVLFFKILYIINILLNINWVGPARLSPVGPTYGPTNPYSSSSCFFWVGWTWPSHLGGVQPRPTWLLAHPATLIREGKKQKEEVHNLAWLEANYCWSRSECCKEERSVAGGG